MKGIILAGGNGTRLYPSTCCINKHLLPIYDKPMIYYPIATLILAGIKDILLITKPDQMQLFQSLLKDGSQWGISISYAAQTKPNGIAEAFIIGEKFIGTSPVCLILGDNIFYGNGFANILAKAKQGIQGGTVFAYRVNDPERYGVLEIDDHDNVIGIEEKPKKPKSNLAVTGLYMYDPDVIDIARSIKPSQRGELEITDVNKVYLQQNRLKVTKLKRGYAWLDTGTHQSLMDASQYVALLEKRQGLRILCPEEIAWRQGYIDTEALIKLAHVNSQSSYSQYLLSIAESQPATSAIY